MLTVIKFLSRREHISIVEAREEYELILEEVIDYIEEGDTESAEEILWELGLSAECIEILV